ncbi:hypothetical protein ASD58_28975 [Duganella sp. Root1480D1]|nr:hypothetical protein ASD58_28975 [Duganella sp. Root1480D1]
MDSVQEEVVISRHPVTAGFIGIITVVYSYIVFVLVLIARDTLGNGDVLPLVVMAPFLLLFGAVGGALFFRSRSVAHQFWVVPALFVLYSVLLAAGTNH